MLLDYRISRRLRGGYTTVENLKEAFEKFLEENGHYPSSGEINSCWYLPNTKFIDRKFGGLKKLREEIGIKDIDMRKGSVRGGVCIAINERGREYEEIIHKILCDKFGEIAVHREKIFGDQNRCRSDFFVWSGNGNFVVDVFYPRDIQSMGGCLTNKVKKYDDENMNQFPVIFLMMNNEIPKERIEIYKSRMKKKLLKNQRVMYISDFEDFLKRKTKFKIK